MRLFSSPRSDRNGTEAVYALLGYAFGSMFGRVLPELKKTPNGKPYFPDEPHIHFSLSHARTHVLCAIDDSPVGVDIESPRTIGERAISYFCSPQEASLFEPLELWVLKESYIKLLGATLPSVKRFAFSRLDGAIIPPEKKAQSKLYKIDGCTAAVSTYGAMLPDEVEFVQLW